VLTASAAVEHRMSYGGVDGSRQNDGNTGATTSVNFAARARSRVWLVARIFSAVVVA